jgi:hypothetical protein
VVLSARHHGCRWGSSRAEGHDLVVLENRWLRVTIVASKGADIVEFLHKPSDTDVLWRSPWPLRAAGGDVRDASRGRDPDLAFLDAYPGGWQELFPVCGAAADLDGVRVGVHGEVCLLPWRWEVERDDPACVVLRFEVAALRTPFRLTRRMTLRDDAAALFIAERVEHIGSTTRRFMWGHHPAFGAPFLRPGCRIDTDARTILTSSVHSDPEARLVPDQRSPWPHAATLDGGSVDLSVVAGPDERWHDWAYLTDFADGWFAVTEPERGIGCGLRWPAAVLPYALYWQNYGASAAPWFGRAYTVALEPQSTFPADFARGTPLLRLGPGETLDLDLVAVAYQKEGAVTSIDADGVVA